MTRRNDTVTYNEWIQTLQGETAAESEIILPDYCPGILKLVQTNATVLLRSQSVRGDRAYVEGAVEFCVVYLSDTAEGLQCVTHQVPFSQTVQIRNEADTSQIRVHAKISYANARALSPQKLYVKATVETITNVFAPSTVTLLDEETAKKVEKKTESATLADIINDSQKTLKMSDEIEITSAPVSKIMRYETRFRTTDKKIINNKMIVKADMSLKITYISTDGHLYNQTAEFPISQVMEIGEADEQTICSISYSVCDCHFNIKENADKSAVDCDLEINICAQCFQNEQIDIITDAFSTKHHTECNNKPICLQKVFCLDQNADFKENIRLDGCTGISDIAVVPSIMSVGYDADQKCVLCQGAFDCSIIYTDTESDLLCMQKSVPFQISIDTGCVPSSVKNGAELHMSNLSYTFDSGTLTLKIETELSGFLIVGTELNAVTEITFSEDGERAQSPIILCYAGCGESVWDIAKKYGASPEKIMQRNGLQESCLSESRMLFITR